MSLLLLQILSPLSAVALFFSAWVKGKVIFRFSSRLKSQHVHVVCDQTSASGPTSYNAAPSTPRFELCLVALAGEVIRVHTLC